MSLDEESKLRTFAAQWARPAEFLLGAVFVLGAALKAWDIDLFTMQIWAYGVLPDKGMLFPAAMTTLAVELLLGFVMLFGLRRGGWSFAAIEALLAAFTLLILYGWIFHGLEDCGCFGVLEMTPGISIAKNVVLGLVGAVAWIGMPLRPRTVGSALELWPGVAATVLLSAAVWGYAYTRSSDVVRVTQQEAGDSGADGESQEALGDNERPFAKFVFDTDMGPFDLGEGDHLAVLISLDCEHCQEEAPALNELMYMPDVPPIVGLCAELKDGDLEKFMAITAVEFPLHIIDTFQYFMLIDDDNFRVNFIRDGQRIKYWDAKAPTYEELLEAMGLGD